MEKRVKEAEEPGRQAAAERRRSRRGLLRKGLGVAAATLGAGTLIEMSSGTSLAHAGIPNDNVGNFSSSNSSVPAVTATGTNGAEGVNASSDTSHAIWAQSTSGGDGVHAIGAGTGHSAVSAQGNGGYGLYATSTSTNAILATSDNSSGVGVYAQSANGTAVYAVSSSGIALVANGHMQVQGNSVGTATLAAGKTSVIVSTSAATASSNILLTPLGNPGGNLWVTRAAGSFTIHASKALISNLSIAYLIIN